MSLRLKYLAIMVTASLMACGDAIVNPDPPNSPESNFDLLWSEFDRWYGLFEVKDIDWDSTYRAFRPRINNGMNEGELYSVVREMLEGMSDCHLVLETQRLSFACGRLRTTTNFSQQRVVRHYLSDVTDIHSEHFLAGRIRDSIGYLYLGDFSGDNLYGADDWVTEVSGALDGFSDVRGLIVDVRDNTGGNPDNANAIANIFADRDRPYIVSRTRSGPRRNDFSEPFTWYVRPAAGQSFTKSVVLLTNRQTISAAEGFTLALKQLPHVTHIGEPTVGALSRVSSERHLPNGWVYWFSIQDVRGPDGVSYEGVGVPPDTLVFNGEINDLSQPDEMIDAGLVMLERK